MKRKILMVMTAVGLWMTTFGSVSFAANDNTTYYLIKPPFVTNIQSFGLINVYLQAEVAVMVNNSQASVALQKHLPAIKHHLIMLFSEKTKNDVRTVDGRKVLRKEALEEIRKILAKEYAEPPEIIRVLFAKIIIE